MDEDEELYREMNEEDDLYMGNRDDSDNDYEEQSCIPNNNNSVGCLMMLPLIAGTLTFIVLIIAHI